MEIITSVNNEKVKHAASLNEKKYRRMSETFLVEGSKLVREVVCGAMELVTLYVQQSYLSKYADIVSKCSDVVVLGESAFNKISSTVTSQGIIAEVKMPEIPELDITEPFIILDGISDPGNLGTIIRTASAVGYRDIVLIGCADPYSPKVVRSSSGGIFYTDCYPLSYDELFEKVEKAGAKIYIADMKGTNVFSLKELDKIYGLVIGSEGSGVSLVMRERANMAIKLPMKSQMESLNAGVSASVIMYELKNIEGEI